MCWMPCSLAIWIASRAYSDGQSPWELSMSPLRGKFPEIVQTKWLNCCIQFWKYRQCPPQPPAALSRRLSKSGQYNAVWDLVFLNYFPSKCLNLPLGLLRQVYVKFCLGRGVIFMRKIIPRFGSPTLSSKLIPHEGIIVVVFSDCSMWSFGPIINSKWMIPR